MSADFSLESSSPRNFSSDSGSVTDGPVPFTGRGLSGSLDEGAAVDRDVWCNEVPGFG
jgi:hypothetical protein